MVPGFISMVISAFSASLKCFFAAATSIAIYFSSITEGVPPPMYSVSKVIPSSSGERIAISR